MNTEQTSENIFTYKNKFYLLWHEISPKIWNLAHNEVKRSETLNGWNLEQVEFIFRSKLVSDKKRNYYITMIIFLPYTFLILVFQNWFLCRYSIMVVYCMAVMCLCATWTDDYYKLKIIFGKAFWKLAINFLLDNWFSNFGNLSFWQIIEVTGSDVAPVMTNRSMYYYENKWLLDT